MRQRFFIIMIMLILPVQGSLAMLGELSFHDAGAGIVGSSVAVRGHVDTQHGDDTHEGTGGFHCCHLTVSLAPLPQMIVLAWSTYRFFPAAHDAVRNFLFLPTIERPDWHVTQHV